MLLILVDGLFYYAMLVHVYVLEHAMEDQYFEGGVSVFWYTPDTWKL